MRNNFIPSRQWAAVTRCVLDISEAPQNGWRLKRRVNNPAIHGY